MRPAWIEVDLSAVTRNIESVQRWIGPDSRVMAIVKANAYGHGAVEVARAALRGGAAMLGVAIVDEAVQLRDAGFSEPILVLSAILPELAEEAVARGVEVTISDLEVARAISKAAMQLGRPGRVHVKVDTGMGRVGIEPSQAPEFVATLLDLPGVELAGLSTHYATADGEMPFAEEQLQIFQGVCQSLRERNLPVPMRHTANSGAIAFLPEAHMDMVRPGLLTYGIPPNENPLREPEIAPALSLKARITQLREMPAGASLSYGRTYITPRPERIALVPLGYGDGYSRSLSNKGQVLVGGKRVPIRGRVCMDQLLVDVSSVPGAQVGDEIVLIGRQGEEEITAWEVALWMGSIPYEVTTVLSQRLPRVYLETPSPACGRGLG